jgi:hypothetical protein
MKIIQINGFRTLPAISCYNEQDEHWPFDPFCPGYRPAILQFCDFLLFPSVAVNVLTRKKLVIWILARTATVTINLVEIYMKLWLLI